MTWPATVVQGFTFRTLGWNTPLHFAAIRDCPDGRGCQASVLLRSLPRIVHFRGITQKSWPKMTFADLGVEDAVVSGRDCPEGRCCQAYVRLRCVPRVGHFRAITWKSLPKLTYGELGVEVAVALGRDCADRGGSQASVLLRSIPRNGHFRERAQKSWPKMTFGDNLGVKDAIALCHDRTVSSLHRSKTRTASRPLSGKSS